MGKGDHSKTFLLLALFYWSTPSWLKVIGGMGGPCDSSVNPSPNWTFGFLTSLGLGFGLGLGGLDLGLELDNL